MREHLQVRSIYPWKESLRDEAEALIIFKTTREKVPQLRAFLEKEHRYKTPEIVEVEAGVNASYLSWVVDLWPLK